MQVEVRDEQDDPLEPEPLQALAATVMQAEGLPATAEVSLTLVGTAKMARLNEQHMGRPGPTDVLSFPIEALTPGEVPAQPDGAPPLLLGDILVCPAVVRDQAGAAGVAFDDEMALMVVHGLLHLLGYDHEVDAEAERMEARERDLLALEGRVRP
jgi:probable rRNA maturation factor